MSHLLQANKVEVVGDFVEAGRETGIVYFDQFLGAGRTQKLVETFFSAVFQPFLFISKLFQ